MAHARHLRVTVRLEGWVIPYLQLWAHIGGGPRCSNAVREYVLANGVHFVPWRA